MNKPDLLSLPEIMLAIDRLAYALKELSGPSYQSPRSQYEQDDDE